MKPKPKYKYNLFVVEIPEYDEAVINYITSFAEIEDALEEKEAQQETAGRDKEFFIDVVRN